MIWVLSYFALCVVLAYVNYRVISYGKRIYHALNGLVHIAFWLACYMVTRNGWLVASLPLFGRVFFDAPLNIMRGLPIDYVPRNPKSIVDKLEKQIFGYDGLLPKIVYMVLGVVLLIVGR